MTTLTLENVTVSRGVGPVIRGVNLELAPARITTIIGPNGAGKTSLLEAVSGMIPISGGRVLIDGEDVSRLAPRRRAKLGVSHVEQGRANFPSLTVRENIEITAQTRDAFDEALALFPELEKRLHSTTALLSGGEQQMVVLARAFAGKPRILLIDEMSLGLAPVVFQRLLPVVRTIASSGVGVLLVEQFAHHALGIADHSIVCANGAVGYAGEAAPLLADPELLRKAYLG